MKETEPKLPVVVSVGELLWDILPSGQTLGGAPSNFACHCSTLGAQSHIVSAVGNDPLGKEAIEVLRHHNMDVDLIQIAEDVPTGAVAVNVIEKENPEYTIPNFVAWDKIEVTKDNLRIANNADAICFGTLGSRNKTSLKTIETLISITKESCLKVFDINIRQSFIKSDVIKKHLGFADVLKLNDEELPVVRQIAKIDESHSELRALQIIQKMYSIQYIALTKGENGSVIVTDAEVDTYFGTPAHVVDAIGAGDSFTASLTMGILQKKSLKEIHLFANKIASFVVTQGGATPCLPEELTCWLNSKLVGRKKLN